MYGLIAAFDQSTESFIKNVWKELKEKSISSYAYEVEDRIPHITLASYNQLNRGDFFDQMDETYQYQSKIDINFKSIGSFLKSGALYYSPTVTKGLYELHSNHHKDFGRFHDDSNSLYLPDHWIPHCTIANRLTQGKLQEAFHYCSKRHTTLFGKIVKVALIEVTEKHKAPIIYSKELME